MVEIALALTLACAMTLGDHESASTDRQKQTVVTGGRITRDSQIGTNGAQLIHFSNLRVMLPVS